ncbi:MAG TPA: DUF4129 domain-containing protein [Candidatus Dormibacteraeota bacterium]|nr:DUF4129 domain-containing protein [Candidatus Dormibacteraeota bacterium]
MSRRLLDAAPDVLAVIAEGAWVAAVYALVQVAARGPLPLGPIQLAVAAAAGLLVARRAGPVLGDRWPRTALTLVGVAAVVGWLAEPSAVAALLRLDPEGALRAHPGGIVAGLAFLRGFAYAARTGSEEVLERSLQLGLPGLAVPVLLTGMLQEPWRSLGLERELVAAVVFLVAATVGVALGRVAGMARATSFDWRRNRAWLALVGLLAVGVVAAAVPASLALAPALRTALAALVAPLILHGAVAGVTQVRLRHVLSLLVLGGWLFLMAALFSTGKLLSPSEDGRQGFGGLTGGDSPIVNAAGGILIVLVLVVGILVLARIWMRDATRPMGGDVVEERTIDRGGEAGETFRTSGRRRAARQRHAPVDATGAYVSLLEELAERPSVRRGPGESPAEHARRLRDGGLGAPGLDLLAADYQLARFAGRRLTPHEERRAIARWSRLRRTLGIGGATGGRSA